MYTHYSRMSIVHSAVFLVHHFVIIIWLLSLSFSPCYTVHDVYLLKLRSVKFLSHSRFFATNNY